MSRCLLSLLIALSLAAVAGAQDDDLDALLAGLGDDDPFVETSVETVGAVEVAEPEPAEVDPFADFYAEPEAISGEAIDSVADVPETAEEVADEFGDDVFADFFDEAPADAPEAPAEVTDTVVETFTELPSGDVEETVEKIWEVEETETVDGFGDDGFDDYFTEDIPEDMPSVDEMAEAPAEEPEAPAEDLSAPGPEAVAVAESEIAAEQAAVEQIAAEAGTSFPDPAEIATLEEGEAAAVVIGQRVRPVEPAVKPEAEKKSKKDKFSSEARKPIRSQSANEPVILDMSSEAPAAPKPSKTSSKASWAEPVLW